MINQKIAKILYEISVLLDMDDVQFKPRAFEKAALTIQDLNEDLEEIYKKGGIKALKEIPSIGEGIARKIEEYIKTGRLKEYDELKKKFPVDIDELQRVEGLGPKGIKFLYKKLKIKNLEELEKAAKANKLIDFEGWGAKKEENILKQYQKAFQMIGLSDDQFIKAGQVMHAMRKKYNFEPKGRRQLTWDILLALSAEENNALILTENEKDFSKIKKFVSFEYISIADH